MAKTMLSDSAMENVTGGSSAITLQMYPMGYHVEAQAVRLAGGQRQRKAILEGAVAALYLEAK